MSTLSRRGFVQSLSLATLSSTVPLFLQRSAGAAALPGFRDDRVLVVIQLSGGNDGLNTLVPYADERYYRARPKLGIPKAEVLPIDDTCGFHPQMAALRHVFEHQALAVVRGIGYPNPNRSHFRSMEIWQTGSAPDQNWTTGWLGRYCDAECRGSDNPLPVVNLGGKTPLTLAARSPRAISVENPALLRWRPNTEGEAARAEERAFDRLNHPPAVATGQEGDDPLNFLTRTASGARHLHARLEEAANRYRSAVKYPEFRFSQSLRLAAQMIAAELPTRLYYVELSGFDTHATQPNRHAALLQELSEGLGAFLRDLRAQGHLDRTLVMTFSEFGRRVAENQSGGTDHGAGSLLFLAGGQVQGGLYGAAPDLDDLDRGDLKHQIDFRALYQTVLTGWLRAPVDPSLGVPAAPLPLFKS